VNTLKKPGLSNKKRIPLYEVLETRILYSADGFSVSASAATDLLDHDILTASSLLEHSPVAKKSPAQLASSATVADEFDAYADSLACCY